MSSQLSCDEDRGSGTLLAAYRLEVVTCDDQCIEHYSENQLIAKYGGEWELKGCLGSGNFGHISLQDNPRSDRVRAVKKITMGKRKWQNREMECLILVKDVN